MGKPRTAGVVAVRRDRATGDTHVLFVSLRWTRSGFKTLMHCLNGAEKATRGAGATKNCTDEELAFFLGEGDDGAAERLWNHPLVPSSWTRDRGEDGLVAARANFAGLAELARRERQRRTAGGRCLRDELSRSPLQMPKGVVDPGETPWTAALRELREEAGVAPEEVRRVATAPGIRAGPMTAFVVTLPPSRDAGWVVEGSAETTSARWVPAREVRRLHLVRQVREVMDKALPNLDEWLGTDGDGDGGDGDGDGSAAKRSRLE